MSLVCTTIPPKVVGTLELYHVSPIPLTNVGKYRVFSNKKGKNHMIINVESGERGELALCLNSFVWDCRSYNRYSCYVKRSEMAV